MLSRPAVSECLGRRPETESCDIQFAQFVDSIGRRMRDCDRDMALVHTLTNTHIHSCSHSNSVRQRRDFPPLMRVCVWLSNNYPHTYTAKTYTDTDKTLVCARLTKFPIAHKCLSRSADEMRCARVRKPQFIFRKLISVRSHTAHEDDPAIHPSIHRASRTSFGRL